MVDILLVFLSAGGVTILASAIVWVTTLIYRRLSSGEKPPHSVMKIAVFVVASVLTYIVAPVELPAFTADPADFALLLLAQAVLFFKAAQLWYDLIWQAVLEKISPSLV